MGDGGEVLPVQAILRLSFSAPQQRVRTDDDVSTGKVTVDRVVNGSPQVQSYAFHDVVDSNSDPHGQYELTLKPVVAKVLNGFDAALLLVGTSKSGKMDYLFGPGYADLCEITAERGILCLCAADIFRRLALSDREIHSEPTDRATISKHTDTSRSAVIRENTAWQVAMSVFVVIYEVIFDVLHPDFAQHDPLADEPFWTMRQSTGSDPYVKNLTVAVRASSHVPRCPTIDTVQRCRRCPAWATSARC